MVVYIKNTCYEIPLTYNFQTFRLLDKKEKDNHDQIHGIKISFL